MRAALDGGDRAALAREAHTLKSSSGNVEALTLSIVERPTMKTTQKELSGGGTRPSPIGNPAKGEMIAQYLPLVHLVAEKIHRRLPRRVDLESLIHSGVVGLLEALERFDPQRGDDFEVYARYRIHGEVIQYLRSLDWISRSVRSWGRKIDAARIKLAGKFVREPTAEEMAKELDVSLDHYFHLDQQVNDAPLLSLEALSLASKADRQGAHEKFSHNSFLDPFSFVERKDLIVKLRAAIENLPERERLIVTLYYHEDLTLKKIGEKLQVSESRICQIVGQIVIRLRNVLGIYPILKDYTPAKRAAKARKEKNLNLGTEWMLLIAGGNAMPKSDGFKLWVPNRKAEPAEASS
jgi:RNA polymerase sigma factor for flagellar operon FliA